MCKENTYPNITTKADYEQYKAAVAEFFEKEGINCLSTDMSKYEEGCIEPHFSWHWCDCCSRDLGGNRTDCNGYNPTTKEVQDGYSVCDDCIYFVEYGRLDDTTMMNIDEE